MRSLVADKLQWTDTSYGIVQNPVTDFWIAWSVGTILNSKQSFAEPFQLVQVLAFPTISSVFLPNM